MMYIEERIAALEAQVTKLSTGKALQDRWATIPEAAAELHVSATTLRRHIEAGTIHAMRLFGAVRIPMAQFYYDNFYPAGLAGQKEERRNENGEKGHTEDLDQKALASARSDHADGGASEVRLHETGSEDLGAPRGRYADPYGQAGRGSVCHLPIGPYVNAAEEAYEPGDYLRTPHERS